MGLLVLFRAFGEFRGYLFIQKMTTEHTEHTEVEWTTIMVLP